MGSTNHIPAPSRPSPARLKEDEFGCFLIPRPMGSTNHIPAPSRPSSARLKEDEFGCFLIPRPMGRYTYFLAPFTRPPLRGRILMFACAKAHANIKIRHSSPPPFEGGGRGVGEMVEPRLTGIQPGGN